MSTACRAAIFALAASAAVAQNPAPFEFKGIPFGATTEELHRKYSRANCAPATQSDVADTLCIVRADTYGAANADLYFYFNDGGAVMMSAHVKTADLPGIIEALTERYGPPGSTDAGGTNWTIGRILARATPLQTRPGTATISFITVDALTEAQRRIQWRNKLRGKDL